MRGLNRERILRVLLTETKVLSKNELSKKAQCTRQWVILFLRELEKKKLVKETKVLNPAGLIKYWLTFYKKPQKNFFSKNIIVGQVKQLTCLF